MWAGSSPQMQDEMDLGVGEHGRQDFKQLDKLATHGSPMRDRRFADKPLPSS